ncbi:hypothetical protein [Aliarcobacter butzleri]|uniref:hypothetical protein n=1 Tax=Aliarcobacter butzleri TaxID=28197 RepID=UPI002B254715|nr:hypothetical protein [Aliarcobacter butzleri]
MIVTLNSKRDLKNFKSIELEIDNEVCERTSKNKLEFECIKTEEGWHKLQFGEYIENKYIRKNEYSIYGDIDKKNYFIKEALLDLNNNNFNGKILVVDRENTPRYTDTKNNFDLRIYESSFNATIKNAEIFFSKPWEEFSKIYYLNNKFIVDFEIENEKLYSYKPYFLTKELNIEDLFSLGQNNEDINLNKLLKIQNNKLLIINNHEIVPNINLFKINNSDKVNGYMKFTIKNINKENKFNLYLNGKHIFKYEYPFFKFDIREKTNDDVSSKRTTIDGKSFFQEFIAPNENEVKIMNNKINEMNFLIEKINNNCKISVNVNKYKKVTKEFSCDDKFSNEIILTQLNIESSMCLKKSKDCVLFEISDLETGLDYSQSPTRDYKY